ncbi:MAG: chromosome partitioning protein ParA [Dyadobacter sp. 50-39]|uniref:AAA family ATPase n=1 Tax=Dyadobacter sp. 50-39 TaxID=1895756 RepID=UPI00095C095D|nr:AAA family ATPase [Dyadobacter sp. 50-39]OJV17378.1 MAG: chromosome partitioning protein ParA [Dyadobacter sp. 50-39]
MVISFNSIKGGVGKSTLATTMAGWLASHGRDVLLVDGDDQETSSDFTAWREQTLGNTGYTLVNMTGANLRKQVEAMKSKYEFIIIDTGGRDTTSQRAALSVADVSMIPFVPRSFDLWTITKVVELIDEIQSIRAEPLIAYTFLSRADIRSADNRDVAEALSQIPQLTYLPYPISNRKAISNAAGQGLTAFEGSNSDLKAIKEIEDLFNYVLNVSHATTTA